VVEHWPVPVGDVELDILDGSKRDDLIWFRGNEVPSGFASCEQAGSTGGASINWGKVYQCRTVAAPSEQIASARFGELGAVWRRCFKPAGISGSERRDGTKRQVAFEQRTRAGQSLGCVLWVDARVVGMECFQGENN
jgi:hypothetical protein